jgi:hypothetical protein
VIACARYEARLRRRAGRLVNAAWFREPRRSHTRRTAALRQKWSLTDSPFVARTGPAEPVRCYCVRNLYATIRATMLAKISSAERDFRIIGLVEWRAADRPG